MLTMKEQSELFVQFQTSKRWHDWFKNWADIVYRAINGDSWRAYFTALINLLYHILAEY